MAVVAKRKKVVIPLRDISKGKFYDPARDGVTNSLLGAFLTCREKARLYLQGWSGAYLSFALVFGGVTHTILRLAYDKHLRSRKKGKAWRPTRDWVWAELEGVHRRWQEAHPQAHVKAVQIMEDVVMKTRILLPAYFDYWATDDFRDTTWIEVEQTFQFPWTVTTRKGQELHTFLRGRIDAAYVLPKSKRATAPRLLETKTRSIVDEENIVDTMPHNRQSNIYLTALRQKTGTEPATALLNVIRKPQLRLKQKESPAQFEARIEADVRSRMDWYFLRMEMSVQPQDINRSEEELNDLVSDFLLWWAGESGHYKNDAACIQPGYGRCDYLRVCAYNDYTGLERRTVPFRELEDE